MREKKLPLHVERFRIWMYISAWMYAISGTFFLFYGAKLSGLFNNVFSQILPASTPYPLPVSGVEGAMWLTLSVSMMSMITWICRSCYLDPVNNGKLVPVLLLSKFMSSTLYLAWFINTMNIPYLLGWSTDGLLFIVTLIIWIPASDCGKNLSDTEAEIVAAIGDAMVPEGGSVSMGFASVSDECIVDIRRLLGHMDVASRVSVRMMIRFIDAYPIFMFRLKTFRRLTTQERQEALKRLDHHRIAPLRSIIVAVRVVIVNPFFNRPDAANAVGYDTRGITD